MAALDGVFLSAVTSEFGVARDLVASDLRANRFEVTVQEDFRQEGGTTLDKLDEYIHHRCRAVVCIVGVRSGSVPPPAATAPYRDLLPEGMETASYTQWEVILALHHRRKLFVFHATPDFVPDQPVPSDEDHPELQARFVHWLLHELARDRNDFSDTKDLQIGVLRNALLPVVGAMRTASVTAAGLAVTEAAGPQISVKALDAAHRLPANRRALIGRDRELDEVVELLDDRLERLVMLVGPAGVGKQALLQEMSASDRLPSGLRHGAGISPILTGEEDLEDLLQAIWEEFYESADPSTVVPRQRRRDLREIETLLFIPNIDATAEHLPRVLEAMPRSFLCVSGQEEATQALPGEEIPIDGLGRPEGMMLFEELYRSAVPDAVRHEIDRLCADTGGNPGLIELLAKDARKAGRRMTDGEQRTPLEVWLADRQRREAADGEAPLGGPEGIRVMEKARAVGAMTPREVLADHRDFSRFVDGYRAIDGFVEGGHLEKGSPRYRLNPVLDDVVPPGHTEADGDQVLGEVFESTVRWARGASLPVIYENRAFVLRMMMWAALSADELGPRTTTDTLGPAQQRQRDMIELGKLAEPALALGGRHGAWEQLLVGVENAARADLDARSDAATHGGDADAEAPSAVRSSPNADDLGWALHQRGSRALVRDELRTARSLCNESLRHREDELGRELTRKNMTLIPLAVVPFAVLVLMPLFLALLAVPHLFPFREKTATVDVTPDLWDSDRAGRETFTVRNVGDGTVWIERIDVVGDGTGFRVVDPVARAPRCEVGAEIEQGGECIVTVESDGLTETALLEIGVVSRSGVSGGDQRIVLVSTPG